MTDWHVDQELLEAWRGGDARAGRRLVDRHLDAVARFFRNKLSHGVEDLLQQTFLVFVEGRDTIREGAAVRAFLLTVAHRVLCAHLRKLGRGRPVDLSLTRIVDLEPGPSSIAARCSEQELVLAGLRQLSIEHQVALELAYWEGLNAAQIAEIVGISHSAMRSRLSKARAELGDRIAELEAAPETLERTLTRIEDWAAQLRAQSL